MAQNEALKEDKKYLAILIGGSLLISLVTILAGKMLAGSGMDGLVAFSYGVEVLGWLWVAGTAALSLYLQARMRHLYAKPVQVEK